MANGQQDRSPWSDIIVGIIVLLLIILQTFLKIKIAQSILQTKTPVHVNNRNCR
jgi:Co/Zn/Cd efflux system component